MTLSVMSCHPLKEVLIGSPFIQLLDFLGMDLLVGEELRIQLRRAEFERCLEVPLIRLHA